jgi:cell division protein FtsL
MKNLEWAKWIVATIVAAVTMSVGVVTSAYGIFETKEQVESIYTVIKDRLDRIESKIDRMSEWQRLNQ